MLYINTLSIVSHTFLRPCVYIGYITANVGIQINIHNTNMAEAATIIGLVASIASLVDLSAKVVSRLHEFTSKSADVPESSMDPLAFTNGNTPTHPVSGRD